MAAALTGRYPALTAGDDGGAIACSVAGAFPARGGDIVIEICGIGKEWELACAETGHSAPAASCVSRMVKNLQTALRIPAHEAWSPRRRG